MTVSAPSIIGAFEIGSLASVLCHGIILMQAYRYFSSFPNDARSLKLAVVVIWVGALANIICILYGLYFVTVTQFGLAPHLIGIPPTFVVAAGLGAFVRSAVQSIYIYRMYKYSSNLYLPILCWGISAYEFVAGIILSIVVPPAPFGVQMQRINQWSWLLYSMFVSAAFVDIITTVSLCYQLRKSREKGLERTVRIIDKLVIWTIQTGLLTSFTAIAVTITYATNKQNCIWVALLNFLTSLYPTAMLALLNGRSTLRIDNPTSKLGLLAFARSQRTLDSPPPIALKDRPTQVRVTVEHDKFSLYDAKPDSHV